MFECPVRWAQDLLVSFFKETEETEDHILNLKYSATYLARAFGGEVVPQDPKDEPTSVLLEHIRAERENQSELKKKARTRPVSKKGAKKKLPSQMAERRCSQ